MSSRSGIQPISLSEASVLIVALQRDIEHSEIEPLEKRRARRGFRAALRNCLLLYDVRGRTKDEVRIRPLARHELLHATLIVDLSEVEIAVRIDAHAVNT